MNQSHHGSGSSAKADLTPQSIQLGSKAASLRVGLGLVGVVGLGSAAFVAWNGWFGTTESFFWRSYLQNFLFVLSIALGALFFVIIQHLTRAGWSVVVRRPAEILAGNLRWMWLLFVVPFGILWLRGKAGLIWPWADMATMAANDPAEAALVAGKSAYLNSTFFWIRTIAYFAIWGVLAKTFLDRSARLGESGDRTISESMQRFAAPAIILFGLSITFAAFDWIMSLSPAWFSTMFGVYFFCGCATAGLAAIIVVCTRLQASGHLAGVVTAEHYQDLGKLLFAFGMVFWAYIGFSQYMLIWYANIPEETGWFLARQVGDWGLLSLALLFGHFVVPFLALISKWPKRYPAILTAAALWMAFFAWIDLYWLVMPTIPHGIYEIRSHAEFAVKHAGTGTGLAHPVNWLLLIGMLGLFGSMTVAGLRSRSLLCVRDPRLPESLRFENI